MAMMERLIAKVLMEACLMPEEATAARRAPSAGATQRMTIFLAIERLSLAECHHVAVTLALKGDKWRE